jgi:hypothetical protein
MDQTFKIYKVTDRVTPPEIGDGIVYFEQNNGFRGLGVVIDIFKDRFDSSIVKDYRFSPNSTNELVNDNKRVNVVGASSTASTTLKVIQIQSADIDRIRPSEVVVNFDTMDFEKNVYFAFIEKSFYRVKKYNTNSKTITISNSSGKDEKRDLTGAISYKIGFLGHGGKRKTKHNKNKSTKRRQNRKNTRRFAK